MRYAFKNFCSDSRFYRQIHWRLLPSKACFQLREMQRIKLVYLLKCYCLRFVWLCLNLLRRTILRYAAVDTFLFCWTISLLFSGSAKMIGKSYSGLNEFRCFYTTAVSSIKFKFFFFFPDFPWKQRQYQYFEAFSSY